MLNIKRVFTLTICLLLTLIGLLTLTAGALRALPQYSTPAPMPSNCPPSNCGNRWLRPLFIRMRSSRKSWDRPNIYVNDGKMTGGFAILAYPAEYGSTGVMTFIVDDDGTVYQRDLGPNTSEATKSMTQFDADSSWQKAE